MYRYRISCIWCGRCEELQHCPQQRALGMNMNFRLCCHCTAQARAKNKTRSLSSLSPKSACPPSFQETRTCQNVCCQAAHKHCQHQEAGVHELWEVLLKLLPWPGLECPKNNCAKKIRGVAASCTKVYAQCPVPEQKRQSRPLSVKQLNV